MPNVTPMGRGASFEIRWQPKTEKQLSRLELWFHDGTPNMHGAVLSAISDTDEDIQIRNIKFEHFRWLASSAATFHHMDFFDRTLTGPEEE